MLKKAVAEKCKIPRNTLSTWLASNKKIKIAFESGKTNSKRKNMKPSQYEEIDKALYTWFLSVRNTDITINGSILKEKAISNLPSY